MKPHTLKDPEDDRWNPNGHWDCLEGVCGECEGSGEVEHECSECDDTHDADCGHCDGSGKCEYDGNILRARQAAAKRRWEEFKDEITFRPTPDAFKDAYQRMFSREADEATIAQWWGMVQKMAKDAGVTL